MAKRVILVILNRGHTFKGTSAVNRELSPLVRSFLAALQLPWIINSPNVALHTICINRVTSVQGELFDWLVTADLSQRACVQDLQQYNRARRTFVFVNMHGVLFFRVGSNGLGVQLRCCR
jgi:hypothetical protein